MNPTEALRIFDELIADYLSNARAAVDYPLLAKTIRERTGMPLAKILEILEDNQGIVNRRAELVTGMPWQEHPSEPSGWTPRSTDVLDDSQFAIDDQRPAGLEVDPARDFEVAGREQTAAERFASEEAARRGSISNFIRSNYGENIGATFRNFLTNPSQQDALQSRFQLAGTASPEGRNLGFADFMKGIGDQPGQAPFRTSGANRGQLDMLARYLATPDSGAFRITAPQEAAIENFRTDQSGQFNLLRNPILANLSPYARGGYQRSSAARFDDWLGRNIDNPNAQYLDYAKSRGFMP